MLGDETQPADSDGSRNRATSGPRHAAPRKSLLTKLHVPAGKAVALAAMPTAVLMGMGFTPHLAQADEMPKNPFKPGPCVTQSDTPSPSAGGTAGDKAKPDGKPTPTTSPSATTPGGTPNPTVSPSASDTPSSPGNTQGKSTETKKVPTKTTKAPLPVTTPPPVVPSAAPTTTKPALPSLPDPLGLGSLLNGLLGGGKTPTPTPTPAPTTQAPVPTPTASTPSQPDPTTSPAPTAAPPAKGGTGSTGSSGSSSAGKTVKDTAEGATKAAKDLTDPTATPKPDSTAKGASGDAGASGDTKGKQSYPCPTYDAKALADATVEQGIPLLPDDPWILKSPKLTLYGLNYLGIVQVKTANGTVKDVLKFTATGIDIDDLDQIVKSANNTTTHVTGAGTTSTFRDGTVTMYTESLSGNLLGLVPVTFTPKAPPPLVLPVLFFTNVTVIQAGQFGGTLHIPDMRVLPNQPPQ